MTFDKGFDFRWKMHPHPQATVLDEWTKKTGLAPVDLVGQRVLDVGCGCGRNSALLGVAGAIVTGIDSSPCAVEAAQENWPDGRFLIVDILQWPDLGQYDFVFSHGVLHHTADPRAAFHNCASAVRVGGQLSVWLYAQALPSALKCYIDFLHAITRACPPEKLHEACRTYVPQIRSRWMHQWDPLQMVIQVSNSEDEEEAISDTFDWHCPQYRSTHTVEEAGRWFEEEGFGVIWTGEFPVSMRGIRRR